ncbi:hypothetical protein ACIQ9Q_09690 [Streptomyces sp. NPDC094438]|uniref:hypothetical protein n=1 Tax=Streptomyces sp. NPDC094438 TaxID=3366061 RepID=UPI00380903F5
MSARHRREPEPVRLPGIGLLATLLGIGLAGPAVVFHDRAADFCQAAWAPAPVTAPDKPLPSE